MRTDKTLQNVLEMVEAYGKGNRDVNVKGEEVVYTGENTIIMRDSVGEIQPITSILTQHAKGQLCGRLQIPIRFLERNPDDIQRLLINHWIEEYKESEWLMRLKDDEDSSVRAVLSDSYVRFDNSDVMELAQDALKSKYGRSCETDFQYGVELNPNSFHLRISVPDVPRNAGLQAGVHISNSETGMRAVTMNAMVYRQVCTNGMIALVDSGDIFYQAHIGFDYPELFQRFRFELGEAMNHAQDTLELFNSSRDRRISQERVEAIMLAHEYSEKHMKEVMERYQNDSETGTVYSFINAITNAAQLYSTDRQYEEETYAGKLLTQLMAA